MKVVTVVSDTGRFGFFRLKASCALLGLSLDALVVEQSSYSGNRVKDELLRSYLAGVDDEEIVLFTDGYDTLMLAGEDEILEKFERAGTDLLVSAETYCFPWEELAGQYPVTDSPYRYLNSGGMIGRAGFIKELLDREVVIPSDKFEWSNQYVWAIRYLQDTTQMKLDTQCEVFCTGSPEVTFFALSEADRENPIAYIRSYHEWFYRNFSVEDGRVFNRITGTYPCNMHFNGRSGGFLNNYTDALELLYHYIPGKQNVHLIPAATGVLLG